MKQRAIAARRRRSDLRTGFGPSALRLAGVTEELDAAEDALRQAEEARIEGRMPGGQPVTPPPGYVATRI